MNIVEIEKNQAQMVDRKSLINDSNRLRDTSEYAGELAEDMKYEEQRRKSSPALHPI